MCITVIRLYHSLAGINQPTCNSTVRAQLVREREIPKEVHNPCTHRSEIPREKSLHHMNVINYEASVWLASTSCRITIFINRNYPHHAW